MPNISLYFTDEDKMTTQTAQILATFFLASEFTATKMGATIANTFVDDGYIIVGETDGMKSILDITPKGEMFLLMHEGRIQERLQDTIPMGIQILPSDWTDKVTISDA